MRSHLTYLGLDRDADELAVKRAYARKLKQIDQEADPQGFQALREAYEGALRWVRQRAARQSEADTTDTTPATVPPENQPPEPGESVAAQPHADGAPGQQIGQQQPDGLDSAAVAAQQVFSEFASSLMAAPRNLDEVRTLFNSAIDDPRLIRVETRDLFEWHVAQLLAGGWQPGHECVLEVAVDLFDWQKDRRRLLRFGWVGAKLDRAVLEMNAFVRQQHHARQLELVRALRRPERPSSGKLADAMPALEELARRYPVLFPLITSEENLARWRIWHSEVAGWRRRLGRSRAGRLRDENVGRRRTKSRSIPTATIFVVIVVVAQLFNVMTRGISTPPATSSYPNSVPRPSASQEAMPLPPGIAKEVDSAWLSATSSVRGDVDALLAAEPTAQTCAEIAKIAAGHPYGLNPRFDNRIITCASMSLWPGGSYDLAVRAAMERQTPKLKTVR